MLKRDAMQIMNMTIFSHAILKKAYVKACFKFHPDRNPAGLEMMKAVNIAYAFLKTLPDVEIPESELKPDDDCTGIDFGELLNEKINFVLELGDTELLIEICGAWLWVTGNTKPYCKVLKEAGFYWASKKLAWYFRPAEWKSSSRGGWQMDKIRDAFGSDSVKSYRKQKPKIEEAA
jgi:hypothetical protein